MITKITRLYTTIIPMAITCVIAAQPLPAHSSTAQEEPSTSIKLTAPVKCKINEECFIYNYVDHGAERKEQDYKCGILTTDGQTATLFGINPIIAKQQNIDVIAAADGIITDIRDNMPDTGATGTHRKILRGRECGNAVIIKHDNNYRTIYCHLKKGSISALNIEEGQEIKAGQKIAEVGLSGNSRFPHLSFTVTHNNEIIDPFTAEPANSACSSGNNSKHNTQQNKAEWQETLWDENTANKLKYKERGIIAAGLTNRPVTLEEVLDLPQHNDKRTNTTKISKLTPASEAVAFWTIAYGIKSGDTIVMRIISPTGVEIKRDEHFFKNNKNMHFHIIKLDRAGYMWETGKYRGEFSIIRSGDIILKHITTAELM